jgi:hypothetical protein
VLKKEITKDYIKKTKDNLALPLSVLQTRTSCPVSELVSHSTIGYRVLIFISLSHHTSRYFIITAYVTPSSSKDLLTIRSREVMVAGTNDAQRGVADVDAHVTTPPLRRLLVQSHYGAFSTLFDNFFLSCLHRKS